MREDLFTVVMEQFPTDTVDYADIVLPATMQTEHLDVNDGYGHMYVHLNRPAVAAAAASALSTTETFRRLAARDGARPSRRCTTTTRRSRARCSATTDFERPLRAGLDAARLPDAVRPVHRRLPDAVGQARVLLRDARRGTATTRSPATRRRPAAARRRPPARADRPRLALVPEHDVRQQAGPDARRPAARAIELHPDDAAAARPRAPATRRACSTRAASFEAEVEVSDRVRPGVIASTKGHWLKHVRGGANVNATVEERDADMGGGADLPRQPRRGRARG